MDPYFPTLLHPHFLGCFQIKLTLLKPSDLLIILLVLLYYTDYSCTTEEDRLWGDAFLIHLLSLAFVSTVKGLWYKHNHPILWAFQFLLEFTDTYRM